MVQQMNFGRKLFITCNYIFLILAAASCVVPLVNVLAVSFSSSMAASSGLVKLWPIGFTYKAYEFVAGKEEFLLSMWVTVKRVVLGVSANMLITVMVAYPLSKEVRELRIRTWYAWIFVFTILFSGGLIPLYILMKELRLLNSIWSLVLPGAVPVFNIILLLNFFRSLPKELMESSFMDGASHWKTLWSIVVPLSAPALATITLFAIVAHWNAWFDGLIYMSTPQSYPLSSYLQTVVVQRDLSTLSNSEEIKALAALSDRSVRAAQIFLGALPVICIYPFLQRYFIGGIVLGSVKE